MSRTPVNSRIQTWTAPTTLQGTLVKRITVSNSTWEGFNLRPDPVETWTLQHRTPKYVEEFTNGRRTIDPSYPIKTELQPSKTIQSYSKGSTLSALVQNSYSKDSIGKVSKPVLFNGKIAYSNATSEANALYCGSPQRFRGKAAVSSASEYIRPISRKQTEVGTLSRQSQIDTIPGPHRSGSSTAIRPKVSPMHISTFTSASSQATTHSKKPTLGVNLQTSSEHIQLEERRSPIKKFFQEKTSSEVGNLITGSSFQGKMSESGKGSKSAQRLRPKPIVASDLFASSIQI